MQTQSTAMPLRSHQCRFAPPALLILFSLLLGFRGVAQTGDPVPLFNGTDLYGWHVQCQSADKDRGFWKVDDGTILCDSMGRKDHNYVWLLTDKEFGDFELRLKFQTYKDSPGNSGLQFRSRFDASTGRLDCPQVDIHPPGPMNWRTGFIYDETREENLDGRIAMPFSKASH